MPAKQIRYDQDAREGIRKGIRTLAKAVKSTLGPRGKNVVLQKAFGGPTITKDGVSVAKEIELSDPLQDIGAQIVKEVASQTNDMAGDGTTTATVLAEAIFEEGMQAVTAGANPLHLKRGIEKAVAAVDAQVKSMSKDVKSSEEIKSVGTIASNNDEEIGAKIAEAMDKVGKDGSITVEEGKALATEIGFVEGMEIDKGYLSPYFVTDNTTRECVLEKAIVLLHEKKLTSLQDLLPIMESAAQAKTPLLVIAESVEGDALAGLVVNHLRGILTCCAVKAPGFGDRRRAILEDLAILTGGQLLSEDSGNTLENLQEGQLGFVEKVIIKKDSCTFINGGGTTEAIQARIEQIRAEIENATSAYDIEKLEERLAKLSGGVAQIKVGAATEAEMKEKKARVEDALHATRAASQSGIVPGGGVALLRSRHAVNNLDLKGDEAIGAQIIFRALERPLFQIAHNAGQKADVVVNEVENSKKANYGFNADTLEYGDMIKAGVVDPTKVVCSTLANASGVASLLLTTDAVVLNEPEKDESKPNPMTGMGGMGGMGGF